MKKKVFYYGFLFLGLVACQHEEESITEYSVINDGKLDRSVNAKAATDCSNHISHTQADSDFFLIDRKTDLLWPGNIVGSQTVKSGSPSSVPIYGKDRNPIEIKIDVVSGTSVSTNRKINEPTPGKVQNNMNKILEEYYKSGAGLPANFEVSISQIFNEEQLQLAINAGYAGPSVSVSGKLGVDFNSKKTKFAVTLKQQFFTISVAPKEGLSGNNGWFTKSVTPERLKPYITDFKGNNSNLGNNPSAYITSVDYGRLFTVIYESDDKATDVEASLKFAYNSGIVSADAEASAKYKKVMKNTSVKVKQLGGVPQDGLTATLAAFAKDTDKILDFIKKDTSPTLENPGYPISYKVNRVSDNKVFQVSQNISYTEKKSCSSIRIQPESVETRDLADHGTSGAELYGRITVDESIPGKGDWRRVKELNWGFLNNPQIPVDHYPLHSTPKPIQILNGQFIDVNLPEKPGYRFRITVKTSECDDNCNTDVFNLTRAVTYVFEYNPITQKWENEMDKHITVGNSIDTKRRISTWQSMPDRGAGGAVKVNIALHQF
ncbi:thiol-activated cytolysin family protein [Aquimarina longa]|uniref:thiol-activated cytolysin family protein n=1 Tax=Aquimarina longa TaxID=1080221 RepID=UPI0007855832|nr:thiol-activated cytolysin family protein [Aquimarina longa]